MLGAVVLLALLFQGHISIDPLLLKHFSTSYYEAGHLLYIDEKSHTRLHTEVMKFMDEAMRR